MLNAKNKARLHQLKARQKARKNRAELRDMFIYEFKTLLSPQKKDERFEWQKPQSKSKWALYAVAGVLTAGILYSLLKKK